jgi:hypothetical protein
MKTCRESLLCRFEIPCPMIDVRKALELVVGQVVGGSTKGASTDEASVSNTRGSATPMASAGAWYKYDATANGQGYN